MHSVAISIKKCNKTTSDIAVYIYVTNLNSVKANWVALDFFHKLMSILWCPRELNTLQLKNRQNTSQLRSHHNQIQKHGARSTDEKDHFSTRHYKLTDTMFTGRFCIHTAFLHSVVMSFCNVFSIWWTLLEFHLFACVFLSCSHKPFCQP